MARLGLDGVRKAYGSHPVLHGVSLEVKDGEFVSLLGPSGCGKTTSLNIVAGFVAADSGRVMIGDQDVSRVPPCRRDSAMVFQNYALFPHMTVFANVAYGLKARKVPKGEIAGRVESALRLLNLGELTNRYPGQLSGGQQQRVAVARALVVRPGVLLMDEPLSNLDVKLRQEIRRELRDLQRSLGQTVLFVTHDQEEALAMSDHIAVMNGGQIEQLGPPQEVYGTPRTVFVAEFMGVENIFPIRNDGGAKVVGEFLALPSGVEIASGHVGIRPGTVELLDPATTSGGNDSVVVPGVVRDRTYLGRTVRYAVAVGSDQKTDLIVEAGPSAHFAPGDSVHAAIDVNALLTLSGAPSQRQPAPNPRVAAAVAG
jgi:ABC-type Fe3+/spermidine/putrescine transport system ATPase subunit